MAESSQCSSSVPLMTFRKRTRSSDVVNVLDMDPNIVLINYKTTTLSLKNTCGCNTQKNHHIIAQKHVCAILKGTTTLSLKNTCLQYSKEPPHYRSKTCVCNTQRKKERKKISTRQCLFLTPIYSSSGKNTGVEMRCVNTKEI